MSDPQAKSMPASHDSTTVYWATFGALMVLLAMTVAAAHLSLGAWSAAIAMLIATAKVLLIGLSFMHLRETVPLAAMFSLAGVAFLLLLLTFVAADYSTRTDVVRAGQVLWSE